METLETMKPGTHFTNGSMELTLLCFEKSEIADSNLILVICSNDGLFITARNLMPWQGNYTWHWGNYFGNLSDALKDYKKRLNDL